MGTSNSDKPVYTKLILDHAGEWYRTAKSIQAHQDNAENQIYSNSSQTGHMKDYLTEIRKSESRTPTIPNTVRDSVHKNSLKNVSPGITNLQLTLPRLDLPHVPFDSKSEDREEIAESLCTDGTAILEMPEENEGNTPYTPGSHKSTRRKFGKPASPFSDFYM